MYEEAGKRKLRMEERIKKLSLENIEANEFIKGIKPTTYNFISDNEGDNNDNDNKQQLRTINQKTKQKPNTTHLHKNKYITNTQFNNKRFETDNSNYLSTKHKQAKQQQQPLLNMTKQKEYFEKYFQEENDNKDQRNMPVPMTNPMKGNLPSYPNNTLTNNTDKPTLSNNASTNVNYIKESAINAFPGNNSAICKESDASRIVDQFFTQNLKHIH